MRATDDNAQATELLLRVLAQRLAGQPCEKCGAEGVRLAARGQAAEHFLVEARCPSCGNKALIKVEPESGDGVVRVS